MEYYFKAPSDVAERLVIVIDPMLATANSAVAAIDRLKDRGAKDIRFVCLLAAPEGIQRLTTAHPDVRVWTAAIDSSSMTTAISCRVLATPATGCTEPARAKSDLIASDRMLQVFVSTHFFKRTGIHFARKCSRAPQLSRRSPRLRGGCPRRRRSPQA